LIFLYACRKRLPGDETNEKAKFKPAKSNAKCCEYRYKGVDDFGDVEWMRCPEEAKLRVLITRDRDPYWH